jgi:hypothetical protein
MCKTNALDGIAKPAAATAGVFFGLSHGSTLQPCDAFGGLCACLLHISARLTRCAERLCWCVERFDQPQHGFARCQDSAAESAVFKSAGLRLPKQGGRVWTVAQMLLDD